LRDGSSAGACTDGRTAGARKQDRNAVVADRIAQQDAVMRGDAVHAEAELARTAPDAGGRRVDAAAFPTRHDVGVARHYLHSRFPGRVPRTRYDALRAFISKPSSMKTLSAN
jgi:hypothetical protein